MGVNDNEDRSIKSSVQRPFFFVAHSKITRKCSSFKKLLNFSGKLQKNLENSTKFKCFKTFPGTKLSEQTVFSFFMKHARKN